MKKISGDVLTRLMNVLQKCNETELPIIEVKKLLIDAIEKSDLYVEINDSFIFEKTYQYGKSKRMNSFDKTSFDKLNSLLPWSSFSAVAQATVLGMPFSSQKRLGITVHPDPRISELHRIIDLDKLSILEVGCFEGHHSIDLGVLAREVWAIDGRIENVIKSLVRIWLAGLEHKVTLNLIDLEKVNLNEALRKLGRTENFDLVHHRGVLYHLSNPIQNLIECTAITNKYLYLHTQIAKENQINTVIEHQLGNYEAYSYREPNIESSPFSGITEIAYWLSEKSLTRLISDLGFTSLDILSLKEERNGNRIEILARK